MTEAMQQGGSYMYRTIRSPAVPAAAAALTVAIFSVDALTSLDVAIAVLYVAVVLMSVWIWPRRGVIGVMLFCMALTLLAFVLSHDVLRDDAALARCLVSLAAIAITGFLAVKGQDATQALLQREEALNQARNQLAHASRVSTLGEMTATIAHEVNQPLAAILTHGQAGLRWLDRDQPELGEVRRAVDAMQQNARRASEVIQRIRGMARQSAPSMVPLAPAALVQESCDLLRRELHRLRVKLKLELAADLPLVMADKVQLQQVVINLVMNAAQAMSEAMTVAPTIEVRCTLVPAGEAQEGAAMIQVEVADNGPGLSQEHMERIFSAFFTTKKEGMGMGLAICRSILEAHHGSIRAGNRVPQGAVMRVLLPPVTGGAS
ncbi:hypothetical protein FYB76_07925 [Herbaspirillum sp. CAH-3]|nr:hypothetical protein [Herbaspirillum sp. CAH-3]